MPLQVQQQGRTHFADCRQIPALIQAPLPGQILHPALIMHVRARAMPSQQENLGSSRTTQLKVGGTMSSNT